MNQFVEETTKLRACDDDDHRAVMELCTASHQSFFGELPRLDAQSRIMSYSERVSFATRPTVA